MGKSMKRKLIDEIVVRYRRKVDAQKMKQIAEGIEVSDMPHEMEEFAALFSIGAGLCRQPGADKVFMEIMNTIRSMLSNDPEKLLTFLQNENTKRQ